MPASVHWVCPRRSARLVALLAVVVARPASAHLPTLHGRLLDLIQRSDVVVLGTVDGLRPAGTRHADVDARVDALLIGRLNERQLSFRAPTGFAAGTRYVFFLQRASSGFESVAPSGTVFPSRPEDDAEYRRTVTSLRVALAGDPAQRIANVRAALIRALSASAPPLRYHAALELSSLLRDGHGPTDRERQQLAALLADPGLDPAVRALLTSALTAH